LEQVARAKTWQEFSFPISFQERLIMHLASPTHEGCYSYGVSGSSGTGGKTDNTHFRLSAEVASLYLRWLAMGK
jgi:hypothetical protein